MQFIRILFVITCVTGSCYADNLYLATKPGKPPYVIDKTDGFELVLVRTITRQMGYQATFMFAPYPRAMRLLRTAQIDGLLTSRAEPSDRLFFSKPYISYLNIAVSIKSKQIELNELRQLQGKRIAAFQDAKQLLGNDYAEAVKSANYYTEVTEQHRQLILLLEQRVDVLILDINVFSYLLKEYDDFKIQDFEFHDLFPASFYSMGFKSEKLKNQFDQAYADFSQSEQYKQLIERYGVYYADMHLER